MTKMHSELNNSKKFFMNSISFLLVFGQYVTGIGDNHFLFILDLIKLCTCTHIRGICIQNEKVILFGYQRKGAEIKNAFKASKA